MLKIMNRPIRTFLRILPLPLAIAALPGAAIAQDATPRDAVTNRATELKASPAQDAATVAPLAAEAGVKVVGRQSGWTQVQAGDQTGWVRAFHLRFQSTVSGSSDSGALTGVLGGVFGGSKKTAPKGTSNIGVRGLSTEELQSAAPNAQAFATLVGLRADPTTAKRFADDGKLVPVKVDYVADESAPAEPPARRGGRR
jgi:hypothetical protein